MVRIRCLLNAVYRDSLSYFGGNISLSLQPESARHSTMCPLCNLRLKCAANLFLCGARLAGIRRAVCLINRFSYLAEIFRPDAIYIPMEYILIHATQYADECLRSRVLRNRRLVGLGKVFFFPFLLIFFLRLPFHLYFIA